MRGAGRFRRGRHDARSDRGFAVVHVSIVMAMAGGAAYGAATLGRAAIAEAQRVACVTDQRVVQTAVETYRILESATIPATGSGPDRHERTIVAAGYMIEPSSLHDVTADGWVVPADGRC
jgi:hypothetical protein